MTLREIRKKLGFKPLNIFRKEQRAKMAELAKDPRLSKESAKELKGRQMGRTTEVLLKAVHLASQGTPALLVGHNPHVSRYMRDEARKWCRQLYINPSLILTKKPYWHHPEVVVLPDHPIR